MRILLEDAGFRVSTASRVGEAYEACRRESPDVVLLDLRLPDGDGLTLLTRLRDDGGFVPVVAALTGRDEPEVRERCRRAGCVDVLVKPVDVRSLGALVRSWLAAPQSPA